MSVLYTGKALSHARAGPHHMITSAAFPCVWRLAGSCVSVTRAVFYIRLLPRGFRVLLDGFPSCRPLFMDLSGGCHLFYCGLAARNLIPDLALSDLDFH